MYLNSGIGNSVGFHSTFGSLPRPSFQRRIRATPMKISRRLCRSAFFVLLDGCFQKLVVPFVGVLKMRGLQLFDYLGSNVRFLIFGTSHMDGRQE